MAFTPQIYSINNCNAIVNDWTVEGLAGDTPMETERTTPEDYNLKVGAKGETTFVLQPDKSGTFVIRVKQNADEANRRFHALLDAGAIFPVKFIGTNALTERAVGQQCVVGQAPRIVFGSNDEQELEWRFIAAELIETRK